MQIGLAKFHFVKIARWQLVLVEERVIHVFRRQIQSPEIAFVLIGWSFFLPINNAQLHPMCKRRFDAHQIEQFEGHGLKHPVLSPHSIISLLNARSQIELSPLGFILLSEIVAGLEMLAAIEIDLPHVLAHGVTPLATARPEAHVIVDLAVIRHKSAGVIVFLAGRVIPELRLLEPGRIFNRRFLTDELIHRQTPHYIRPISHRFRFRVRRIDRSAPGRHSIINEIGKIAGRLFCRRRDDSVIHRDPVTHQPAMRLQICR